jgi:hypothetical protein
MRLRAVHYGVAAAPGKSERGTLNIYPVYISKTHVPLHSRNESSVELGASKSQEVA